MANLYKGWLFSALALLARMPAMLLLLVQILGYCMLLLLLLLVCLLLLLAAQLHYLDGILTLATLCSMHTLTHSLCNLCGMKQYFLFAQIFICDILIFLHWENLMSPPVGMDFAGSSAFLKKVGNVLEILKKQNQKLWDYLC